MKVNKKMNPDSPPFLSNILSKNISCSEKIILIILYDKKSPHSQEVTISQEKLAELSGLSRKTVGRLIKSLKNRKIINIIKRKSWDFGPSVSFYALLEEKDTGFIPTKGMKNFVMNPLSENAPVMVVPEPKPYKYQAALEELESFIELQAVDNAGRLPELIEQWVGNGWHPDEFEKHIFDCLLKYPTEDWPQDWFTEDFSLNHERSKWEAA